MPDLNCSYCGAAIEPQQICCPGCGTKTEFEQPPIDVTPKATEILASQAAPNDPQPDRRLRFFELALVCTVAFGTYILSSTEILLSSGTPAHSNTSMRWVHSVLHEISALVLLWYVLFRRGKTFASLGLSWSWREAGFGVLLFFGSLSVNRVLLNFITAALQVVNGSPSWQPDIKRMLFGDRVPLAALLIQFINPFFEELIVRAYLMTEIKSLTRSISLAVFFSVLLQTSYHFYQGVPAALSHTGLFLLFSLYYAKTGRIGAPILAHFFIDATATLYYMVSYQI